VKVASKPLDVFEICNRCLYLRRIEALRTTLSQLFVIVREYQRNPAFFTANPEHLKELFTPYLHLKQHSPK
jgi:hypothetical protein